MEKHFPLSVTNSGFVFFKSATIINCLIHTQPKELILLCKFHVLNILIHIVIVLGHGTGDMLRQGAFSSTLIIKHKHSVPYKIGMINPNCMQFHMVYIHLKAYQC